MEEKQQTAKRRKKKKKTPDKIQKEGMNSKTTRQNREKCEKK